jgi:hypothetical protein
MMTLFKEPMEISSADFPLPPSSQSDEQSLKRVLKLAEEI